MQSQNLKSAELVIEETAAMKSQARWRTVLVVMGWYLRIFGAITFALAAIVFVVWGIFSPTTKDFVSAFVSMAIGFGEFYFGKQVIAFDQSGLKGVLAVETLALLAQIGFIVSGQSVTNIMVGQMIKNVVVMLLVWLGYKNS